MVGIVEHFGTDNPSDLFDKFHKSGTSTLRELRKMVNNPENFKKPRSWGAIEAAELIGVSNPTFRKALERYQEVPGIILENNEKSKKFSLEAINFLRDKIGTRYKRPTGSEPLVIAVTNLKGGVGKTITSVELAKKMAIEGLKVLLLDFDAQGTATLVTSGLIPDLDVSYEQTITDSLISNPKKIRDVIISTNFDGLDIIPANLAIQDCELMLPNTEKNNAKNLGNPFERLNEGLTDIKENYDIILIDCSPNIGPLTLNAIIACDGLIIPIPPNMNNYSSFITYTETLKILFSNFLDKKIQYLRILLSIHKGNNEALMVENMMRQQYGKYVLTNHMCETVEVGKAANEIGTIYDISKPQGNKDAYRRAIQHLDDVNMEIINNFKSIWEFQSQQFLSKGKASVESVNE